MNAIAAKIAGFLITASACNAASASFINPMEYYDGQRTWLQFSETTNLSIEDVITGKDQWITKYRFATQSEIDYLLNRFGIVETDYTVRSAARIGDFVFQVGGQSAQGGSGTYLIDGSQGVAVRGLNIFVHAGMTNGEYGTPINDQCPAYTNCSFARISYGPQSFTARDEMTGMFMVRSTDVPEPASVALFGIAAAAAVAGRRKKSDALETSRAPN